MLNSIFGKKDNNNENILEYNKEMLEKDISLLSGLLTKNISKIKHKDFDFEDFNKNLEIFLTKKIKICFTKDELEDVEDVNLNQKDKLLAIVNVEDFFIHIINEINSKYSNIEDLHEEISLIITKIYIFFLNYKKKEFHGKKVVGEYIDDFYINPLIKFNYFDLSGIEQIDEPDYTKFHKILKKHGMDGLTNELEKYSKTFLKESTVSSDNVIRKINGNQILGLTMLIDNFIQTINNNYLSINKSGGIKAKIDFNEYTNNRYFFINEFTINIQDKKVSNGIIFSNFDAIINRFGENGRSKTQFQIIFNNYNKPNLLKNIFLINDKDYSKLILSFQKAEQKLKVWSSPDSQLGNSNDGGNSLDNKSELFEKFKNEIILNAIRDKVTDIHIKIFKGKGIVNFRLDNKTIQTKKVISKSELERYYRILIEKSKGDSGNVLKPQDGKLAGDEMKIIDPITQHIYNVEARINLGQGGDKMYLRLTGNSMIPIGQQTENKKILSLNDLGYLEEDIKLIDRISSVSPNGLILITGATGQGKSTLLFTLLNDLLKTRPEVHMLTIEDPVEMKIELFNVEQNELKDKKDYPVFIKAFLRQDPDWIMVGETRDSETLFYLKEAALTGHLCFSTFHANNTMSTLNRMINLLTTNISERKVALAEILSFTQGIISQKLIPKVCEHCKIEDNPKNIGQLLQKKGYPKDKIVEYIKEGQENKVIYYKGNPKGCKKCNYSGYSGRQVLVEILPFIEDDIIKSIENDEKPNIPTLFEKGLIYVQRGTIDLHRLIGEV